MKRLAKLTVFLVFLFSVLIPFQSTEAATAKTAYVNVGSGSLNVRSAPSTHGKVLGYYKNGTKLTVYSQTKSGWSEIRYKSKKAYVSTKYLSFKLTYLQDKNKVYVYKKSGTYYTEYYTGKSGAWDVWTMNNEKGFIRKEDSKGLHTGKLYSEFHTSIQYPVKINKKWLIGEGEYRWVSATNKTVKTAAGTFSNCLETKDQSGVTAYYAPNIGLIKVYHKGKLQTELAGITNR
ncbi:SH3 domain-containing protein [Peribacillus sp. SCS-26]|uniref:SH3 domain-containing protein n=1 Tax=Paraperibacillus marinus TaxID=3115295 RepID=UPI00390587A5